ncbi:glutelin [Musa troglodytarum]|uniref:Glutelin n=1 Tax=Musa troglodytarum TaxID=320322 RepID=A0A9E7K362_9LILI|nr:glutelin [Musa troglodytarum]
MAASSSAALLSISLLLLPLCHGSLGFGRGGWGSAHRRGAEEGECQIERLNALSPTRRVQSEAGVTEYFDENNEQFKCAGVNAFRRTLLPRGLLLPSFSNAPRVVHIIQGRGIAGIVIPGCPETFQSFQEEPFQEDEHQRILHFREGDVIALPAGVAHWCYNNGDRPVIAITVVDISNNANQLDRSHREFLLAGKQRSGRETSGGKWQETSGNNVLSGFDVELLAQATGLSEDTARKIQGKDDERGEMVRVEKGLEVLRPSSREQRESERERGEREEGERERSLPNGLDETYCSMKIVENIADPSRADVYTPRGGSITTLNSLKLGILREVQLSTERVVLYRNAILAPYWNINAHSIMYVTGGRGRVQIVSNQGRTVFDGEVRQGQLLIVPQNYAVIKQAQGEGFEWTSFKTNGNAMVSQIVGKASVLRGMPEEVLMNSYRISNQEARRLKFNRGNQMAIFSPRSERRGHYDV